MANALKTPRIYLLGVFLWLGFNPQFALAECGKPLTGSFTVARVIDGDTLKLADGRSIRLLSVNTPEITHGSKLGEPLGREAAQATKVFVARAGGQIKLAWEQQRQDRYGRWLAHAYDLQGRSLGAHLVRQGLGFVSSVPPNDWQVGCLAKIQKQARTRGEGVWSHKGWRAIPVKALVYVEPRVESSFKRLSGMVLAVDRRNGIWLDIDGGLQVHIPQAQLKTFGFSVKRWRSLLGKEIEVYGWVAARKSAKTKSSLYISVYSPASLREIGP